MSDEDAVAPAVQAVEGCWKCKGTGEIVKGPKRRPCPQCVKVAHAAEAERIRNEQLRQPRREFKVAVVGAGIGGCACALALGRLGFSVTLLERDAEFGTRKQGYGLTLQQGFAALRTLNLEVPQETPSKSHFAFNAAGHILGYFGSDFSEFYSRGEEYSKKRKGKFSGTGRYNMHIPRQHLRYMLWEAMDSASPGSSIDMRWNTAVERISVNQDTQRPTLHFGDGGTGEFDLVVASDGIFSSVRRQVLSDPLTYLNCVVVLGISAVRHPLTHERVCETMDGETRIYTMPFTSAHGTTKTDPKLQGKDSIMWQLSFPVESEEEARKICETPGTLKAEALRRCGKWHDPIPQLLEETDLTLMSGHPVYDRPELNVPALQKALLNQGLGPDAVLLIGDAAHCMTPFKGQGANQALLDATELATAMSDDRIFTPRTRIANGTFDGPLTERTKLLSAYQQRIADRSAAKVRGSRHAAIVLHVPSAITTNPALQPLLDAGVGANTPEDINEKVIEVMGFGHHPHLLHEDKIRTSRADDQC